MEILPGIHHLKQDLSPDYPGFWTVISVVVGERVAVIDTGVPGSVESLILPCLAKLGRQPTEIAAIVNTHGHGDHIGGNGTLKGLSGAPIMIHEADAANLDQPGIWSGVLYVAGPADVRLRDGDVIDLGNRQLEVVALPGHSAGCIGVYLQDEGVLFTGDSLQALGSDVQHLAFYTDPDAYAASLERALELGVQHLVPGHAYLPYVESHLHGAEVRRFLEISIEFARGLDAMLLRLLRETNRPATAVALADQVCVAYGTSGTTVMATATVAGHLDRLVARGEVSRTAGEPVEYAAV